MQLGHNYIGTEHILLGIIREGEGVAAQVLIKLGADLHRVRQQVIQLLSGYQGKHPKVTSRPLSVEARLSAIEARLAAMEQRVGVGPDTSDLDERIGELRREKEHAIDVQDFDKAGSLRDQEKELLDRKAALTEEWGASHPGLAILAEQFRDLRGEVERLHALLRRHGIEPEG